MPKSIPTLHLKSAIGGVLIGRKQMQRNMRTTRLEEQAQKHVQRILREAHHQAEIVQQHAYQQGYQQGMLYAMKHVAAYMAASQTTISHWHESLITHVREMLTAAVDHPDTLLLLLEEWLRTLPKPDETLYLTLPDTAQGLQPKLINVLKASWTGPVQFDYHAEPRFVMRYADRVAEFSPEQYVELASRSLQQYLDTLPEDCRRVSKHALQQLIEQSYTEEFMSTHHRSLQ